MDVLGQKMPSKKYFIAIVIPSPLFEEIEEIKMKLFTTHGLKGALRSPSHITLHRPFEWKLEKENSLIDALKQFTFDLPITIALKNFDFFEPRVVYLNVVENELLVQLQKQLVLNVQQNLRILNELDNLRGFHPHITLAFRDLKKPKFYELQKIFCEMPFEAKFSCNTISLLRLEKKWEIIYEFPSA